MGGKFCCGGGMEGARFRTLPPSRTLRGWRGDAKPSQEGTEGFTGLVGGRWAVKGTDPCPAGCWGAGIMTLSSPLSRKVSKTSRRIAQMRGAGGGDLTEPHSPYPELGLGSPSPNLQPHTPPRSLAPGVPAAHASPKPSRA